MLDALQNFTQTFPEWARWVGIFLISALPFIESYFGSTIGIIAGVHPVVAVAAAVVGNTASMLLLVFGAHRIRRSSARRAAEKRPSRSRARLNRLFGKWGVPGVSLLGQAFLPSQITSMTMVSFGASRNAVAGWQIVSIILWGTAFGAMTAAGVDLLG